jgi:hypothetical protein
MKKIFSILMLSLMITTFAQNAEWTGVKTFKSSLKFIGLPVNNGNTRFMTLDATGKPCISDVPTPAPQFQSDWNATGGLGEILNKPNIPDISGLATNAYVDTQDQTKVDKAQGERLINAAEITKLANQSGVNTGDITLTTYGTSGAATLSGNILNIPSYSTSSAVPNLNQVLTAGNTAKGLPIELSNGSWKTSLYAGQLNLELAGNLTRYTVSSVILGEGAGQLMWPPDLTMGKYAATSVQGNDAGSDGNVPRPNWGLPVYANNAAAVSAGLINGSTYRTSTGVLMVVY